MDTPGDRLSWARLKSGYTTPTEAARSRGWAISTYLGHENGDRIPSRAAAKKYGRAFKVRWEWILEGEGSPTDAHVSVPVWGHVGAGAQVIPFEGDAPLDEIELPPGAPVGAHAVIVKGNSMWPRYFDGEHLFYLKEHRPPNELIGKECVVRLRDGRMFIKILRRGSDPTHFTLESWNAPPMEDQDVDWVSPVRWRA